MMSIDGSTGGGQMLRTALGLSALTGKPFEMVNIRSSRPNPGLQAQHLTAVRAVASLCNADVDGADLRSTRLRFTPAALSGGTFSFDIGTAGSISLVLQAALLPAVFAPKPVTLRLTGGTDVPWSPPIDYLKEVLLPVIRRFCASATLNVTRRGYYPAGLGSVELKIVPSISRNAEGAWERFAAITAAKAGHLSLAGKPLRITGVAHASASLAAKNVSSRIAESARMHCKGADIRTESSPSASAGGGITLWATYSTTGEIDNKSLCIGASRLLGDSPEACGEAAARELNAVMAAGTIDDYLSDQLIPWLVLTNGAFPLRKRTEHAATNAGVVARFVGDVSLSETTLRH